MIYAQPKAAFQAVLDEAPTGLVGMVGVRVIKDSDGSTAIARTTAGITEVLAGSGIYLAKLIAPEEAGQYTVVWDTGTVGPKTTVTEEMVITANPAISGAPSGYDLCTLADVRQLMQKSSADHEQDAMISTLITRCSFEVMDYAERQFAPVEANVSKVFSWERESELCNFTPWDLQSLTDPTSSVVADTDNPTSYTLTAAEYRLWPYQKRNGVYQAIKMRPFGASFGAIPWERRQVTITGTWGFPAIPPSVTDATALTVVHRLTVNVAAFRRPDEHGEDPFAAKMPIPSEAMRLLNHYKRVPF